MALGWGCFGVGGFVLWGFFVLPCFGLGFCLRDGHRQWTIGVTICSQYYHQQRTTDATIACAFIQILVGKQKEFVAVEATFKLSRDTFKTVTFPIPFLSSYPQILPSLCVFVPQISIDFHDHFDESLFAKGQKDGQRGGDGHGAKGRQFDGEGMGEQGGRGGQGEQGGFGALGLCCGVWGWELGVCCWIECFCEVRTQPFFVEVRSLEFDDLIKLVIHGQSLELSVEYCLC